MKNKVTNQKGFTLLELVLTITILGLLAASVAPSFATLLDNSNKTSALGTGGAIQSAINTKYAENVMAGTSPAWPTTLDSVAVSTTCSSTAGCFSGVAQNFSSSDWKKGTSTTTYNFTRNGSTWNFSYNPSTGAFTCTSGTGC